MNENKTAGTASEAPAVPGVDVKIFPLKNPEKDHGKLLAFASVNLGGVFRTCKAVVPGMKARKYGRIVIISSIGGRTGRNVGVNYAASKAGVNGMAINLGYMLAPWNITVNSVAPGPLKGKMFSSMPQAQQDGLAAGIPLGRIGELSDIAAAVAYLGSDDAAWTTGEVLDVNGGLQY